MLNKHATFFLFVLLTFTSVYAASIEQPNSVPQDADLLQTIIADANKGYPGSQFKLGEIYSKGNGVPQDY